MKRRYWIAAALAAALPLAPGAPALGPAGSPLRTAELAAQEREIEASGLPRDMVDRLIRIVNDPATHRFEGPTEIPADSVVKGHMVVMGTLVLAGWVEGDVIVVGGDAELRSGSVVEGDLTVVDGELRGDDRGRIAGLAAQVSRAVSRTVAGTRVGGGDGAVSVPISRDRERGASSHFALRVADFNRVEGIRVVAGPVLTTGGDRPFRASALLVWRGEGTGDPTPLEVDRTGFQVEVEQFLAGNRALRVGGGVHSTISPVESWGLSDRENALSAFVLTGDYRDHFQRRGWRAFVRATPEALPLDLEVGFERDEYRSAASGDPWTLLRRDRAWRDQPLAAHGTARSIVARASVDTRDRRREPGSGWLVEGTVRRGVGGTLTLPAATLPGADPGDPPIATPTIESEYTTGLVDVRRYHRVGRGARLNLRGVVGGSLDGGVLPPQFQHALGGPGSLPGHPAFAADCGSSAAVVVPVVEGGEGPPMRPWYGCDRFAVFQAEYRGALNLRAGFGTPDPEEVRRDRHDWDRPSWIVFFNAGRAWSNGDWGSLARTDSPPLYDAGIGLSFGEGGIYWATPLGEHGSGSRFHIRIERRF